MSKPVSFRVSENLSDLFDNKLERMGERKAPFLTKLVECTVSGTLKIEPMKVIINT